MIVNDFLYGEYEVDKLFTNLITSPAMQRLRWIALSNIPSVSYPMISGVSRYAHSLGVFILADKTSKAIGLDKHQTRELMFSALLHDAGMPPLGHLTEEALGDLNKSFDHEESLNIILFSEGKRFYQMPDGENIGVIESLIKAEIDSKRIFATIKGKDDLGNLIASNMDLDNIDNVIRLYKLIFNTNKHAYEPLALAADYFSGSNPKMSDAYEIWCNTRMQVYNKLMFSIPDFAQKATIKRIIRNYFALESKSTNLDDIINDIRFMNDYQFLNRILGKLKDQEEYTAFNSGKYDKVIAYGWINTITKNEITELKNTFLNEHNNYYIDHIPDKRFKHSKTVNRSENGALIGLFRYGKSNKKQDSNIISELHEHIPELELGVLPDINSPQSPQLSLI
jgi:HD superfamily phosphohydrolase